MKDKDFDRLMEFSAVAGGMIPINQNARELIEQTHRGEVLMFKELTNRDLSFHKCYMSLLSFIYDYLPEKFKTQVPKKHFYQWLKVLKNDYDVVFTFKDGRQLIEYHSIAFGNMSQKRFEEYIKLQLPWIYENVIGAFFEGEIYDGIVETIEEEYQKFLQKL